MKKKFYWVRGQIFENSENRYNGKGKAIKYCRDNNIDESEICELSNDSELKYLKKIISEGATNIRTHQPLILLEGYINCVGDMIPRYEFNKVFRFKDGNDDLRTVFIADTVYDLDNELILVKTIFDHEMKESHYYLEVYLLVDDEWYEWRIGDKALYIKNNKEKHKRFLAQKKVVRSQQKYDRLLRLRNEGKISEKQSQELYRLQKIFEK